MGWNGSGGFTREEDFTDDLASGPPNDIVSAAKVDNEFDNYKVGLQNCLTRDGQNSPSANISFGTYKLTNLGTPTSSADATTKAYVDGVSYLGTGISALGSGTVASLDLVAIADVSDLDAGKKVTAQSIANLAPVSSVGLTMPAEFSVASSPLTAAGTIAVTKATQTANLVYAGPSSGGAAVPTFRALAVADLPTLTEAMLPAGTVVQQASTNKTDSFTTTSTSFTDITGFSISVSPVNASDKVMVRAVMQVAAASAQAFLQLVRDTTPIGIGSAAGSRTTCSASIGIAEGFATQTVVIEYLDSPATTSNVTYKVQAKVNAGGTFLMNRCASDSDSAARPTTASTISFQRSTRG